MGFYTPFSNVTAHTKLRVKGWYAGGLGCHTEGVWQAEGLNWQELYAIQQTNAQFCIWGRITPFIVTSWGAPSYAAALQKWIWGT